MKAIVILVSPDGQIRLETKGFSGQECQQASRFLEKALGRTAKVQLKPEFYQIERTTEQQIENE